MAVVLGGIPDLPGLISMSVYETKLVHFISVCFNDIKWIQKTWQVYDPKTKMVRDDHFLLFCVNDS